MTAVGPSEEGHIIHRMRFLKTDTGRRGKYGGRRPGIRGWAYRPLGWQYTQALSFPFLEGGIARLYRESP